MVKRANGTTTSLQPGRTSVPSHPEARFGNSSKNLAALPPASLRASRVTRRPPGLYCGREMLGLRGELGALEAVGRYRIVLPLGQGGTADVYLAAADGPNSFTKLVVVKVL